MNPLGSYDDIMEDTWLSSTLCVYVMYEQLVSLSSQCALNFKLYDVQCKMTKIFNGKIYLQVYMYNVMCHIMGVDIHMGGKANTGSVILRYGLS